MSISRKKSCILEEMRALDYLPSKQFSFIALSLFLSVALVYGADAITKPTTSSLVTVDAHAAAPAAADTDWQASLSAVQTESGDSLPAAPSQNTVNAELQAAQSSNVTDSISRTLLVNLVNAKQQGLGDDIPTQDQLVSDAMSQINSTAPTKQYVTSDLAVTDSSSSSLHEYGNAIMNIMIENSNGEYGKTLVVIDDVTSQNKGTELAQLPTLQKAYTTIAKKLLLVPVPKTLEPFHLELVNDYTQIAATYPGIGTLLTDPLGGLAAIQQYNLLTQDTNKMFINIAQAFDKNDILFTKDEPGATWAILLQAQQQ